MRLPHYLAILTMLSIPTPATAQSGRDSLQALDYEQLQEHAKTFSGKEAVWEYLYAWISKAKVEQDYQQEFEAYRNCLYESDAEQKLVYADSMLYAAEKTHANEIIGSAHLTRGIVYYSIKDHNNALENYILANRFIATTNAAYLRYKTRYNMGLIKYYLGYYNEALSLFKETAGYYEGKHPKAYINSLHNIALCYDQLSEVAKSRYYTDLAQGLALHHSYQAIVPHLELLSAIHMYKTAQYSASIRKIKKVLPKLSGEDDFATLAVACYYLGRNYWDKGQRTTAITWLEKVDAIAFEQDYIRPDLRQAYELLINYYEGEKKPQKALYYIRRLLAIDKVLESDFKYLSSSIHRQYDTYSLMESKERMESELKSQQDKKHLAYWVLTALSVSFVVLFIFHLISNRRYKKRFEAMMQQKAKPLQIQSRISTPPDINPGVRDKILKELEGFEQRNGFTRPGIRADELAREFGTNSKYLTWIIQYYRSKNFTDYLNGLRIDYITDQLQQYPKLRRYTYQALAEEAGFSTAQHFTRAFGAKVKMPPSFFIQELDKRDRKSQG